MDNKVKKNLPKSSALYYYEIKNYNKPLQFLMNNKPRRSQLPRATEGEEKEGTTSPMGEESTLGEQ